MASQPDPPYPGEDVEFSGDPHRQPPAAETEGPEGVDEVPEPAIEPVGPVRGFILFSLSVKAVQHADHSRIRHRLQDISIIPADQVVVVTHADDPVENITPPPPVQRHIIFF